MVGARHGVALTVRRTALRLVRTDAGYKESYLRALEEFHAEGSRLELDAKSLSEDFEGFVQRLLDGADASKVRPGWVPDTVLWIVEGEEFVGRVSIRHRLSDDLLRIGGHIGYEVKPTRRRQGYGKSALRLALSEARQLGLRRVLVTCDSENTGSRKIIEANGGQLENETELEGRLVRRYWIELE